MLLLKNTSWLIIIILKIFLIATSFSAAAQDFTATAQLAKDTFTVGDKIEVLVNVELPQGHIYRLQKIPQLQGLEWLDSAALQKSYSSANTIFSVIAFDSGTYTFPALSFSLLDNSSNNQIATTSTQALQIQVKYAAVDTTQDIKPIKAPMEVAYSPVPFWVYALIILALLAVAYFAYKWWKKKQQKPVEKTVAPVIQPQNNLSYAEEIIEKIKVLKEKESGQNYWFGLKEILREYISRQYKIRTQEKTSAQMLADLKQEKFQIIGLQRLKNVFSRADLAIFAQQNQGEGEKETAATEAINFIKENMAGEKEIS
jgi:hypothetical protein